jgi:hypothetical protein
VIVVNCFGFDVVARFAGVRKMLMMERRDLLPAKRL